MADEITPEQATKLANRLMEKYLEEAADLHLRPYVELITESIGRSMKLVSHAGEAAPETAREVLRAVVVMNHAYLEDFLRNVALWLLPISDEDTLKEVPLLGLKRGEKFHLGTIAAHRGRTVEDLIRDSVAAYMDRSTFNSVTEIMSFLESINVRVPREDQSLSQTFPQLRVSEEALSQLDEMIKRRHQIVHRADRSEKGELKDITESEVLTWMVFTLNFTLSIAGANFATHHNLGEFQRFVAKLVEPS